VFLRPLFVPVMIALAGAAIGYFSLAGSGTTVRARLAPLAVLLSFGVLAALLPFSGQTLYDIGLPLQAVEAAEYLSFAVVGLCAGAAWRLFQISQWRWVLVPLVLVSLAKPAATAFTYYIWDTRGFGP